MFGQGLVPEWAVPEPGVPEPGAVELGAEELDEPEEPVEPGELWVVVVGAVVVVVVADAHVAAAPPPKMAPTRADAAMAVRGRIMCSPPFAKGCAHLVTPSSEWPWSSRRMCEPPRADLDRPRDGSASDRHDRAYAPRTQVAWKP